ncbi:putative bifunctional diguanylate cyclase/phosphodiesterase [Aliamphritea ceti]|uniref:putative bifunctional diguanylate cyclase/phosphodiesterase n=1 Tax=Aliamphritea ceti TaxID=1524258 RepID=UPI0021C4A4B6|nr:bifunctional diguanylate cyclase/phosphodiesterase [Aliamphritea ceti]
MLDIDQLQTPIWIYDIDNYRIHWANESALTLWHASSLEELTARDFQEGTSDAVQHTLLNYLDDFALGKRICHWWQLSPKGKAKDVYCQFSGVYLDDGRLAMLVEGLHVERAEIAALVSGTIMICLFNEQFELLSANPSFRQQFGTDIHNLADLIPVDELVKIDRQLAGKDKFYEQDICLQCADGNRWHSVEVRLSETTAGDFVVSFQDIHERKSRELELQQMATHDVLTGVFNRKGLFQRMKLLHEKQTPFSIYYIDLDGFKPINDGFGHAVGDSLLCQVASRLRRCTGDDGDISRIGGDEFVVILPEACVDDYFDVFATALVQSLSGQYKISDDIPPVVLSVSVGVASYPRDDDDLELLLADADAAMYMAKGSGRRCWIQYRKGMREQLLRRTQISQRIGAALLNDEFEMCYQPVFDMHDSRVVIVEALVRWPGSELAEVSPDELIDVAEHCGLIGELSSWIFYQACQEFRAIRQRFGDQVLLSLNVSGLHIQQGRLISDLEYAINSAGLLPQDLVLELTERVIMPDSKEYSSTIDQLIGYGFSFAIDDFGTGFSSLAYLNSIPAKWVKLDREFVSRLDKGVETVTCIHKLVDALGMNLIVEGVETRWQVEKLKEHQIFYQQGYYHFSPANLRNLLCDQSELKWVNVG